MGWNRENYKSQNSSFDQMNLPQKIENINSPVQGKGLMSGKWPSLMAGGHLRQLVDPENSFIEKSNLQFDKNLQMLKAILIKKLEQRPSSLESFDLIFTPPQS